MYINNPKTFFCFCFPSLRIKRDREIGTILIWLGTALLGLSLCSQVNSLETSSSSQLKDNLSRRVEVTKDALEIARQSARAGDPDGMFLIYRILSYGALDYHSTNQQLNLARYRELASRSLSERLIDIEAFDSLYLAASLGLQDALIVAAYRMAETIGQDNGRRLRDFAERIGTPPGAALQRYLDVDKLQKGLGETMTSARTFLDVLPFATKQAVSQACLKEQAELENGRDYFARAVSLKISRPLRNEVYLPSNLSGFSKALLISGQWEETWIFNACKKLVNVKLRFEADGMGGTRIQIPSEPATRMFDQIALSI